MNAEATVLKLYPLGENGLIAVWCTEEGLIRTAAKAPENPAAPLPGVWTFSISAACSGRRQRRGSAHPDLRRPAFAAPGPPEKLPPAQCGRLFRAPFSPNAGTGHAHPGIYDLLQRAYTYLENNDPTLRAVLHFEQELARLHGIAHPGIPAHVILKSHFGKLPSQREKLLGSLEQKES
ncbi:hypothetical protein M5E88_03165 [Akkermansia muciniphila]|nr:hypothetical protein M5E88_03165 [Akkermansia muciniphila]